MAMQGKSTSGDKPSLDIDEAELAANTFRPSWDADDFGSDGAPVAASAGAAMAATLLHGSASMPNVPEQGSPILSEVVPLGSGDVNETAPFRSQPKVTAAKPADSSQLGVAPAAANTNPLPGPETPPEAAGLVVAASEARAPAPSAEVLDSASVVEATPSIPHAPVTAPLPRTPDSSPSVGLRAAGPMTATASARAAAVTQTSPGKPRAAAAYAAADPFRHPVPAPESDGDLNFVRKPLSKRLVFAAVGVVALVAVGLFATFGSASPEELETKSAVRTSAGPAVPAPTNDIPPPPPKDEATPPKDEATPPKAAATLASEATPVPSPAKAAESLPPRAEPSTPKTTANAPTHSELKPKAAPVTPKTPPKATGGGIVRDSPF